MDFALSEKQQMLEHDITLRFKRTAAGEVAYGGSNYHYRAAARALGL